MAKRKIIKQSRSFKGVWIPKEIWLAEDLSPIEILVLTEIQSLDNDEGCTASNSYLACFFGVTRQRISQIISSLKDKKYIKISYDKDGDWCKGRAIKVVNKFDRGCKENLPGCKENLPGCKENLPGCKENFNVINTDNNTINNTSINKRNIKESQASLTDRFEKLWKQYPKKQGKKVAFAAYKRAIKKGVQDKDIELGISNYNKYIKITKKDYQYIKQGSTWFNQSCWDDEYNYGNQPKQNTLPKEWEGYYNENGGYEAW